MQISTEDISPASERQAPADWRTLLMSRWSGHASRGNSMCATASCELVDDHFSSQQVPEICMPLFVADAIEWATQSSLCEALDTATGDYSSCGAAAPALMVSQVVFCVISTTGKTHLCATACIRDISHQPTARSFYQTKECKSLWDLLLTRLHRVGARPSSWGSC